MKILRNKTYQGMVDEKEGLKKIIANLEKANEDYFLKTKEAITEIQKLQRDIQQLEREKKKLSGAKGGYVARINKLEKQVEELKIKLEESMSGKYVLKKIPSGRRPKGQPMKLKDCSRISNISRKVFGEN